MGFTSLSKKKTLVALALCSSLIHVPAWSLEVSFENPSGPLATSQADGVGVPGDVIIKPTGFISSTEKVIVIDSNNAVIVEADNISAVPPGLTTTTSGNTVNAQSPGSISVGANSGIILLAGNGSAIDLNGAPNFAITNAGTIQTKGTDNAINVDGASNNFTFVNSTGGLVSGADDGFRFFNSTNFIILNEADATIEATRPGGASGGIEFSSTASGIINNSGTIQVAANNNASAAIFTFDGSSSITVNNFEGGSILAPNAHGIFQRVSVGSQQFYTIDNAGAITVGRDAIYFSTLNTGNITNQSTGTISADNLDVLGFGMRLNGGITGNILNDGSITSNYGGIYIGNDSTGHVTNNGSIVVGSTNKGSGALIINGDLVGNITNNGTMSSTGQSTLEINNIGANGITGDVINTGTISQLGTATSGGSIPENAVEIRNKISGIFDNQGTITTAVATEPAIFISGNVAGGIFNSGDITGVAGNVAVEIDSTSDFTQTAGTITGHVSLENNNTATFTGGTVNGDIQFTNPVGTGTLNIGNTAITGRITTLGFGGTMNVTDSLTTNDDVFAFSTVNVNAGTWTANDNILIRGGGPSNLNINNTATLDLYKNLNVVVGAYTLTVGNDAFFNVNNGASITNGAGTSITQNGTMTIAENTTVDINTIAAGAGSVFNLTFTDLNTFSDITLNALGSNVSNSTFNVSLTGLGFITQGDQFAVIDSQANGVAGMGTINIGQPQSLTLSFSDQSTANQIILQAERSPFQGLTNTPNSDAAATALDVIVNDPNISEDLKLAIAQIDVLGTIDEVSAAIEALLPDTSGGMVELSQDLFNRALHTVEGRIHEARSWADILNNSMPAGDEPYFGMGFWGKVFAASASQKDIDIYPGYTTRSVGFTTGFDKSFTEDFMLGAAFTYSSGEIEGKQRAPNEIDINTLQLIGYGEVSSGALFFNGMLSAALNRYKSSRLIEIGTFRRVAKADYKAWQYAGKFELGYAIANGKYRIEPIIGGKYTMLDTDGYTEATGGGINLAVQPRKIHDFIGSVGIRLSSLNEYVEALYVPEFRAFINYDFVRDNILTSENFVSNGAVLFETRSAKPDPMTYNLGAALSAYALNLIFSANYDISFRKQYIGHYGSFKIRYEW